MSWRHWLFHFQKREVCSWLHSGRTERWSLLTEEKDAGSRHHNSRVQLNRQSRTFHADASLYMQLNGLIPPLSSTKFDPAGIRGFLVLEEEKKNVKWISKWVVCTGNNGRWARNKKHQGHVGKHSHICTVTQLLAAVMGTVNWRKENACPNVRIQRLLCTQNSTISSLYV